MVTSVVVLQIFLLLLPGFCTQKIKAKIATLKASTDLDRITDALVYSLLNYASVILFGWLAGIKVPNVYDAVKAEKIDLTSVGFTPGFIVALFGVSLFWGFLIGFADDQDWLYRILRAARLSTKSGRVNVWSDVFHDVQRVWVRVHLEDGRMIVGWPDYYSGESGQRELFLKDAAFMDQDGSEYPVDGPGVLVTIHGKIAVVEMLNSRKEMANA
jgi:hypothetical protein